MQLFIVHIYTDADMLYINVYVYSVYMIYEAAFLDVYSSPTRLKTIDSEVSHEYLIYQQKVYNMPHALHLKQSCLTAKKYINFK